MITNELTLNFFLIGLYQTEPVLWDTTHRQFGGIVVGLAGNSNCVEGIMVRLVVYGGKLK